MPVVPRGPPLEPVHDELGPLFGDVLGGARSLPRARQLGVHAVRQEVATDVERRRRRSSGVGVEVPHDVEDAHQSGPEREFSL